jgi:LacI family transcriptional regulator
VQRYFSNSDIQVQVVESNYHHINVKKVIDFWNPIGCIAECGSDMNEFRPEIFGKLPTVYLDRDPSLKGMIRFSVNADLKSSAEIAAKELLALDFDDYAFVGFQLPLFWTKEREKAFCEAIKLNGRKCHVFDRTEKPDIRRLEALRKWLKALPKPCGILAAYDGTAEEILAACSQENIRVPEDVAVMGIDNNEEICENTKPTLSSICPDFENAGFICGELLDLQLRDPKAKGENRKFGILGVVKRRSTTVFKHTDAKVTAAVEYIRMHASDGIGVNDVVAQMGCSRRTAEVRFASLMGHTIQTEIRNVRMATAFAMLRNPRQAIERIANLCGYDSDSTLRYAFKAKTGMSMREWRKKEGIA